MKAELLALRTAPTAMRLLASALALTLFLTVSYLGVQDLDRTSAGDAERAVQTSLAGGFVMFVGGLILATGPHRHGTYVARLLLAASRGALLRDQAAGAALLGAAVGLACAIAATLGTLVLCGLGGGEPPETGAAIRTILTVPLYAALAAAAGAGLGAVIRSQAAAVTAGLVLILLVEPAFAGLSAEVEQYGPSGAAAGLVGLDEGATPPLVPALALLVAYTALSLGAGLVATARRDL